jgi:hypothetical protein
LAVPRWANRKHLFLRSSTCQRSSQTTVLSIANMENMELDGNGCSGDMPRVPQADSFPHEAITELPPAPSSAPTSASIFAPSAAPVVEEGGEYSNNMPHVLHEEPFSHQRQDLAATSTPTCPPTSAPSYAPTSAPTSTPLSTTECTPTPTIEKDGDGYHFSNMSDVSLGESFTYPQAPTSAATFGLNPLIPSDPDPGFLNSARYNHADTDSAYDGDSFLSDTTSLNSEVTKYRTEHGRRYHGYKDGAYWVCTWWRE